MSNTSNTSNQTMQSENESNEYQNIIDSDLPPSTSFTNRNQPISSSSSSSTSTATTSTTISGGGETTAHQSTTKARPLSRTRIHHRAELPTRALKDANSMRLNTRQGLVMFSVSLGAALFGAQLVHMLKRPNVEIPDTLPDFIALDKEREEDEKARRIVKGQEY